MNTQSLSKVALKNSMGTQARYVLLKLENWYQVKFLLQYVDVTSVRANRALILTISNPFSNVYFFKVIRKESLKQNKKAFWTK